LSGESTDLSAAFAKAGLPTARRHLFLCTGPRCCAEPQGQATWDHLKASVREHSLPVMRTKAACLRMCEQGPWLVVYPEGVWYSQVTPDRFDRIRREHLEGGVPVQEWVRAVNPLGGIGQVMPV
jgi:(2Fe-2S) ferredoxin